MLVRVCDLCKQEIIESDYFNRNVQRYKIKRFSTLFDNSSWIEIDAHRECIEKLLTAANKNKNNKEK